MNNYQNYIEIDVSKETLDVAVVSQKRKSLYLKSLTTLKHSKYLQNNWSKTEYYLKNRFLALNTQVYTPNIYYLASLLGSWERVLCGCPFQVRSAPFGCRNFTMSWREPPSKIALCTWDARINLCCYSHFCNGYKHLAERDTLHKISGR